jgi:hypothetical protein
MSFLWGKENWGYENKKRRDRFCSDTYAYAKLLMNEPGSVIGIIFLVNIMAINLLWLSQAIPLQGRDTWVINGKYS